MVAAGKPNKYICIMYMCASSLHIYLITRKILPKFAGEYKVCSLRKIAIETYILL